jgi:hypothetical protein
VGAVRVFHLEHLVDEALLGGPRVRQLAGKLKLAVKQTARLT